MSDVLQVSWQHFKQLLLLEGEILVYNMCDIMSDMNNNVIRSVLMLKSVFLRLCIVRVCVLLDKWIIQNHLHYCSIKAVCSCCLNNVYRQEYYIYYSRVASVCTVYRILHISVNCSKWKVERSVMFLVTNSYVCHYTAIARGFCSSYFDQNRTATFTDVVDPGMSISFLFAMCRYLSVFRYFATYQVIRTTSKSAMVQKSGILSTISSWSLVKGEFNPKNKMAWN